MQWEHYAWSRHSLVLDALPREQIKIAVVTQPLETLDAIANENAVLIDRIYDN